MRCCRFPPATSVLRSISLELRFSSIRNKPLMQARAYAATLRVFVQNCTRYRCQNACKRPGNVATASGGNPRLVASNSLSVTSVGSFGPCYHICMVVVLRISAFLICHCRISVDPGLAEIAVQIGPQVCATSARGAGIEPDIQGNASESRQSLSLPAHRCGPGLYRTEATAVPLLFPPEGTP